MLRTVVVFSNFLMDFRMAVIFKAWTRVGIGYDPSASDTAYLKISKQLEKPMKLKDGVLEVLLRRMVRFGITMKWNMSLSFRGNLLYNVFGGIFPSGNAFCEPLVGRFDDMRRFGRHIGEGHPAGAFGSFLARLTRQL